MRIEVYHAANWRDVPDGLYLELDGMDDRYIAAFDNYPEGEKLVVAAWGTTGEVDGDPIAALVATEDHIITGYIDTYFDVEPEDGEIMDEDDDDYGEPAQYDPIVHKEPNYKRRLAALLARLRRVTKATWLLVHDADEIEGWIEQGFRIVEPPADVPADEAVTVLAWGELPEDVYALLRARGLSWRLDIHRGFVKEAS